MDEDIDFNELLADAEQEETLYDDFQDDIEAELAMEAEASMEASNSGMSLLRKASHTASVHITPAPKANLARRGEKDAARVEMLNRRSGQLGSAMPRADRTSGPVDFDEILRDAEQHREYDELEEDLEAELAMNYEGTGSRKKTGIGVTPPASTPRGAPAAGLGTIGTTLSTASHPTPQTLEKRLGLSRGDEEETQRGMQAGSVESMVTRALNNEGLSPLNPVLQEDPDGNRWTGGRATVFSEEFQGSRAASNRRPDERMIPGALSASSHVGGVPSTRRVGKVNTLGTVLSRPALDCETIPFMQADGKMMHLRVRPGSVSGTDNVADGLREESEYAKAPRRSGNLLGTPMAELMDRVNEQRVIARSLEMAAVEERAPAEASSAEATESEGLGVGESRDGDGGRKGSAPEKGRVKAGGAGGGGLWVDRYTPKGFRDLLSDERINREVLRAVKAWDQFVFKRDAPASRHKAVKPDRRPATRGGRGKPAADGQGTDNADTRPDAKVIMLCGPPGLGKTTLAQVVARHAGYRVYEINASDDRTAPVLAQRMTEAMEGNTLLADKRPNLIVLDEVDGADGKAASQVIVEMATAPLTRTKGEKKGPKRRTPLTRPLVLICNDQWTPALRPIRALAQVYVFRSRAAPTRLVQRLKAICAAERLSVGTDALTRLADRSHMDVRSCLNTLQFVARKAALGGVRDASAAVLTAVAEGAKDERGDFFQVLRSVFTIKRGAKRRLFAGGDEKSSGMLVSDRPGDTDVFGEVEAFNDHGKVMGGLHETFLGVRFNDPTLCKAAAAVDWLHYADLMDARIHRTQDHSFERYGPLAAAGMHHLCRTDQRANVAAPKKEFEFRAAHSAKSNILQSFCDGRQLGSTGRTSQAVVLDMLSHLMDVLAPNLRPLNPDLQSPHERARFRSLVGVLLSCGLNFAPQSAATGGLAGGQGSSSGGYGPFPGAVAQEFALEPAIDQLLKYDGYDFAHATLAVPLRPIVAHEVNLESMRQAEASRGQKIPDKGGSSALASSGVERGTSPDEEHAVSSSDQPKLPFAPSSRPSRRSAADSAASAHGERTSLAQASSSPAAAAADAELMSGTIGGSDSGASTTPEAVASAPVKSPDRSRQHVPFWNRTNRMSGKAGGGTIAGTGAGSKGRAPGAGGSEGAGRAGKGSADGQGSNLKRPRDQEPGNDRRVLRYHFRAGYTNAIRRPVRMRDLL